MARRRQGPSSRKVMGELACPLRLYFGPLWPAQGSPSPTSSSGVVARAEEQDELHEGVLGTVPVSQSFIHRAAGS